MDLHAWITQQVDEVEAAIRAGLEGRRVAFQPNDGGPTITGAVTAVTQTPDGAQFTISQYDVEPIGAEIVPIQSVVAALRRCEADRRILARHCIDPTAVDSPTFATACDGCRSEWVQDDCEPFTANINDCPELLDLAHAHGIAPEILAGLDRPQSPEPKPPKTARRWGMPTLTGPQLLGMQAYTPMRDVPEALRGPRWKP